MHAWRADATTADPLTVNFGKSLLHLRQHLVQLVQPSYLLVERIGVIGSNTCTWKEEIQYMPGHQYFL